MRIRPDEFQYEYYMDGNGKIISSEEAEGLMEAEYVNDDPMATGPLRFKKQPVPRGFLEEVTCSFPAGRKWLWKKDPGKFIYWLHHADIEHPLYFRETEQKRLDEQNTIINMVLSGDFTLREALYIWKHACVRCRNALLYKYDRGRGYSEDSETYRKCWDRCMFCKDEDWN